MWFHRFAPPDKRRPVLVISRSEALEVLRTAIVAPITSTVRGLPSEVLLGAEHGLKGPSAANLDHVQAVRQEDLSRYIATVPLQKMAEVCRALAVATGCD